MHVALEDYASQKLKELFHTHHSTFSCVVVCVYLWHCNQETYCSYQRPGARTSLLLYGYFQPCAWWLMLKLLGCSREASFSYQRLSARTSLILYDWFQPCAWWLTLRMLQCPKSATHLMHRRELLLRSTDNASAHMALQNPCTIERLMV